MALTIDGNQTLGPGPHQVLLDGLKREFLDGAFPGLAGRKILTLAEDCGAIRISGILRGAGAGESAAKTAFAALANALDTLVQDGNHTIVDAFGGTWAGAMLASWRPTGPRLGPTPLGGGQYEVCMAYESDWVQNDFSAVS
ncbi:MAG: hypothetical protein NTX87_10375 [Planctomycetota bacterium]|nr:hypothetical protein [Planctomycetota bacterium]